LLQSILASPKQSTVDDYKSPVRPSSFAHTGDMEFTSSTPNNEAKFGRSEVKVTPPEVKVSTPEEEDFEVFIQTSVIVFN